MNKSYYLNCSCGVISRSPYWAENPLCGVLGLALVY